MQQPYTTGLMSAAIEQVTLLNRYTCRQHVENYFSTRQMTDNYEAVYQKVVAERFAQNGHLCNLVNNPDYENSYDSQVVNFFGS